MSHSPRLFMRPLAVQPTPSPLNVLGTPAKYLPDLPYQSRLTITGGVGKCKVDILSSNNLPPSAQVYVDNVLKELVIRWPPFTTKPAVMGPVRNGNFDDGLNFWESKTPGWKIGQGQGDAGGYPSGGPCLEFPGNVLGEGYIDSEIVPCNPGDSINFGCWVQQGASAAGNASGQSALVFIDLAGNETVFRGTVVDDGANREWHESRLLRQAPPGSVYVRGRLYGKRTRENKPVFFDNVTWNHAYTSGNNGTMPVDITVRVSDAMNQSVTKSYIILPWGAVRHFVRWEMIYDGVNQNYAIEYDPVSALFVMTKPSSTSLFTSPDCITWTEMLAFFPTALQTSGLSTAIHFNPDRGELVGTGFDSGNKGYRFTVAGGCIVNTNTIGASAGLANAGALTVTGSGNTYSIYNAQWGIDTSGVLRSWRDSGMLEKVGTNWCRTFTLDQSGAPLASYTITRNNTTGNANTRALTPAEGFPAEPGQLASSNLSCYYSNDLGYGMMVGPTNTGGVPTAAWTVSGRNDLPVKVGTVGISPVASNGGGKMRYVPWAGEWIRDINVGSNAQPYTLVGNMSGGSWAYIQSPTLPTVAGHSIREMAIAPDRELLVYHVARYIFRAVFQ